jgi:hypothetical protein
VLTGSTDAAAVATAAPTSDAEAPKRANHLKLVD